ncbi:MAG: hypothetical protein H6828_03755 [Planctomycetes bacterium]|nr:hypothetical protein [Planctomycetota bacterium]
MTRTLLSLMLCGLCLAVGLYTAQVQAQNYAKGAELDAIKSRCDLLEATSERSQYELGLRLDAVRRALPAELAVEPEEAAE